MSEDWSWYEACEDEEWYRVQMDERRRASKYTDEDYEALQADYELLSTQMIYQGNSVQHWCSKARAYGDVVGRMFDALREVDIDYEVRSVEPMLAELIASYRRLESRIIELESAMDIYDHPEDYRSAEHGCS